MSVGLTAAKSRGSKERKRRWFGLLMLAAVGVLATALSSLVFGQDASDDSGLDGVVNDHSETVDSDEDSPPLSADPYLACAQRFDQIWRSLRDGDSAHATDLLEQTQNRRCRTVSTRAERHFLNGWLALVNSDFDAAVDELRDALGARRVPSGDRPSRPLITYYLALSEQALNSGRAVGLYAGLIADYPAWGRTALALPLVGGIQIASGDDRLAAALEAIEHHNYSAAERLLAELLEDDVPGLTHPGAGGNPNRRVDADVARTLSTAIDLGPEYLGEAVFQLAYLYYYWIRVNNLQALPLLEAVVDSNHDRQADGGYYLARAHMRAEDYPNALPAWERFAARFPRDSRVHEATYYSGWLHLDREEFDEAIPGFEAYLEHFSGSRRAENARWYLGWCHFRLGRYSEAREYFAQLAEAGGYLRGAKGRYWEGRSFRLEGRESDATEAFSDVADRYTFTYYGLLARQALSRPLVPERVHDLLASPREVLARQTTDDGLNSLHLLLEHHYPYRARRYFDDNHPESDLSTRQAVLVRQAAGDAHDAFTETRGNSGRAIRRPPTRRTMSTWLARYPRPYTVTVETAAEEFGIDPLLIWSHMQIESHYHPGYVSYADAQGLLQLIPRTGQNVAVLLEESYEEGQLMNQRTNVRYGARYLAALLEEFGSLPLAISAYNAGAHNMHRWVDQNAGLEFDVFIEEIAYDQSREYVKKVIGMYAHYLFLYADDETVSQTLRALLPTDFSPAYQGVINW